MARGLVNVQARITARGRTKLEVLESNVSETFSTDKLKERAVRRAKKRFLQEIDPKGRPWQLLSPATRKRVGRLGADQILVDSGALFESINYDSKSGPNAVRSNTGAGFRLTAGGPDAPYARRHQLGLGFTPRRRFLGLDKNDIRSMERMIDRMLAGLPVRP